MKIVINLNDKDYELLKKIDKEFEHDRYIDGMLTSGKMKKYTLSLDSFKELEELVKDKIYEAYKNIREGNFNISPLTDNDKLDSCKYCSLKDICYMKKYDYKVIEKEDD